MTVAEDLLAQANELFRLDARRPVQATLRRAISTAYYALFHQLTESSAALLLVERRKDLRLRLRRKFRHDTMKRVAQATAKRAPPPSPDVLVVAQAFAILQEARHEADYDFSRDFKKAEARDHLASAQAALSSLANAAGSADGERFLVELLVGLL